MGLFYTNITLHGPTQKEIVDFLTKEKRTVYISPTVQKFTIVYDKETEDQKIPILQNLALILSKTFECQAMASMVQDGDVYQYWLYDAGLLIDEYNSTPGYLNGSFGKPVPPPIGGDARKLCMAFQAEDSLGKVEKIFQMVINSNNLDRRSEDVLIGEEIHRELARVLGIPQFGAEIGYHSIENGFLSDDINMIAFTKINGKK